ncbi:MAG: ABC transporter substrate-binding protein [Actinomycetota bacterium]
MRKIITVLLAALLAFAFSCSPQAGGPGDMIKIGDETGDWGFPSPYGMYPRGPGYIRMSLLFDTLVWKDRGGKTIPMLAESWDYESSDNSFTFILREGVRWHDGKVFDASDVAFTFNYIKEHPWVWVDSAIIEGAERVDDYKVVVYIAENYAPFLNNIAGTLPILPEHVWSSVDEPLSYSQDDALIGTGPFILKDYSSQEGSYLYGANEDYYLGEVNISQLAFIKVSSQTMPAMLRSGEIDAGSIPPDAAGQMGKELEVEEEPPVWAAKLILNHHSNELLADRSFRQALAYAVDLEQIVGISQRGFAAGGSAGLVPPANSEWYNGDVPSYPYDPGRAEEIIEEFGFEKGQDGYYRKEGAIMEFELAVSQGNFERDAQVIKDNLEKAGIKIDLVSYEAKTLDNKVESWDFDMAISGHGGLGGDPESLNRVIIGDNFNSVRYFEDERLVELLKLQVGEMDEQRRLEMVHRIQEIYARELPSITLYYPKWYWAHTRDADIYYTPGGIALGIPVPVNKIAFVDR